MNQFVRPVPITPEAHLVQSFWKLPDAPVGVQVNSMVLASRQPVVFDTGMRADRDRWLAAVTSVVEPEDVRWIVLTHDDPDHVGNLETAMVEFANATVVASWWMTERLTGSIEIDPTRMRWIVSGEALDIGDRTLVFERPPLFDSPTTRAVFDPSTGLYWAGDLGAAPGPDAPVHAPDTSTAEFAETFLVAHRLLSPWFDMLDDRAYQAKVTGLARLGIRTWVHTHGPVYTGGDVDRAISLLREITHGPAAPQPGQDVLDAIVASILDAA
jgi:flavorubredoxin